MSKSCKVAHVLGKKWRSKDVQLRENVDFSALLLSERVLSGLEKAGFKKPSPIQVEAIPLGKFGRDLVVQSKSGTGKTLVFVVTALETLKPKLFRPQVLVIVPTREIATQVCSVIKAVSSKFKKLTCNSFIGGLPLAEDQGKAVMTQIVVGTPGRLKQLILMRALPTNSIRLLIFDEADELFTGTCFKEDIEDIFKALPDDKQVLATSATFSSKVKNMVAQYLCDPLLIHLNRRHLALLGMVHYFTVVEHCPMPVIQYKTKLDALEGILKTVKFAQCLLFVNGIQRVEILYKDIKKWGFSVAYMSSAKEQLDRLKAIDKLKRFKCKVLVSSNVTARGIDAENVDLVINFDLAFSTETYMHRVGRAGRYGTIGAAISIIDDKEIINLESIQKEGNFKALKLPDSIPKDLISNVPESDVEFTDNGEDNISDNDSTSGKNVDVENKQLKDLYETNDINNVRDNDCNSEKNTDVENNQLKDIYGTIVDTANNAYGNVSPEPIIQSSTSKNGNHNDITKPSVEDQITVEKIDKDDIAHSIDINAKTVHFKEQNGENVESRNTHNPTIKLIKIEDNLLNDIDKNELISCQSSDKSCTCDIHKNSSDLCEKDDVKGNNIENDAQLIKELSIATNIEKNDFESDDRKLKEIYIDNASKAKNIVESKENGYVHCEQENIVNTGENLDNMIKTFIVAYESNKKMEPTTSKTTFDKGCQQNEKSGKKLVTIDMINNLKSLKQEFLYRTFKNFQESKDSVVDKNEAEDEKEESNEDNTEDKKEENNEDNPKLVVKKVTTVQSEFEENSDCREVFLQKPHFESTPQHSDKTEQEILKLTAAEVRNPVVQNKLSQQFQGPSNEPEFDDLDSISEYSADSTVSSVSADSESLSSSSDSEDDSDSETNSSSHDSSEANSSSDSESDSSSNSDISSSTTASSMDDSVYHHNYSRTGRQNPSLISESSSECIRREFDPFYYRQILPRQYACCAEPVHHNSPFQQRSEQMIREPNGSHNFLPYYYQVDFNRVDTREPHAVNHSGTQFHYQQTHPSCSIPNNFRNRSCTIRGGYKNCKHQISQRNPRHHHTLNCYLPTRHRCHPITPGYHCENGPLCDMWYRMFYNQWRHIQNVIN